MLTIFLVKIPSPSLLYMLLIWSSSFWARTFSRAINEILFPGAMSWLFWVSFSILGFIALLIVVRKKASKEAYLVLLVLALGTFVANYLQIVDERIHIVEYGILGILLCKEIPSPAYLSRPLLAIVIASLAGIVDEFIQYFAPERVCDVRDMLLNAFSALWGICLFEIGKRSLGEKKTLPVKSLLFILSFLLFPCVPCIGQSPLIIKFFDVGEGDAALVSFPSGEIALIDTGNSVSGMDVVRRLQKDSIKNLNFLFLTHPHLDHIGASFAVIKLFNVGMILDNGEILEKIADNEDIYRWYANFVRKRDNYRRAYAGNVFNIGPSSIKVLWPPQDKSSNDWNESSLVFELQHGKFRALFMGDAPAKTEHKLLAKYSGAILKAQVLKAGHHGASDTASLEFIKQIAPKAVIISVNRDNKQGYPSKEVLSRYQDNGARVYRTDLDGIITVEARLDGEFVITQ